MMMEHELPCSNSNAGVEKSNGSPWNKLEEASQFVSVMGASSWPSLSHSVNKIPHHQEAFPASPSGISMTQSSPESESITHSTDYSNPIQNPTELSPPTLTNTDQKKNPSSSTYSKPASSRPSRNSNQHNHNNHNTQFTSRTSDQHNHNTHNTQFTSHRRGNSFNARGRGGVGVRVVGRGGGRGGGGRGRGGGRGDGSSGGVGGRGEFFHSSNNNNHNFNRRHQPRYHDSHSNRGFSPRPLDNQPQEFTIGTTSFLGPQPYSHLNSSTVPISSPYINAPSPAPEYMIPYSYYGEPYFSDVSAQWYCFTTPYVDMMRGVSMNPQPFPMYVPEVDLELCNSLLAQIEYYFSDRNLMEDSYLKGQMDNQGWVSVHLISEFKRVKHLTSDINLILDALRPSALVEVQGNKMRRRGDWNTWISPSGSVSPTSPSQNILIDSMKNLQLDGGSGTNSIAAKSSIDHILPNTSILNATDVDPKGNPTKE
ncbi:uncharacterized protein LOC143864704 isoform X1 [Tasmannia lanceolata]|uniref:uncharacterized protein LOC143864704 isoform X1 n=1 Tax=Tasmannia lanceolata TaxID=3420 RepID=UPI00406387E4